MKPRSVHRIPILLATVTAGGLSLALISEGWGDALSWLLLLAPLLACAALLWGKRSGNDNH